MKKCVSVVCLALVACAARGGVVTPVGAAASSNYSNGRKVENLIDGSGLDPTGEMHDSDVADNKMWMSSTLINESVRFNFGGVYRIEAMKIWNFNWTDYISRGVKDYDVLVSTQEEDPGTDFNDPEKWTVVTPVLTLAQATGNASYTGADPVTIDADAYWLAIRIFSCYGGTNIGLSEVRFSGGLPPPPPPKGTTILVR